uniref:ATP synthase F0 subunit 8 n=1 Tax=Apatidelia acuminata TaxID=1842858 RepID=UPI0022DCDA81|nr:ATP synthase F0 subunit 8 [Apatidelia acuminata]UZZ43769.1 ATP synthase F0 subunit 8 [Apatidelia acuminata]
MPQMMPMNWMILYFMFNLIFYMFITNNYFNMNFQPTKITQYLSSNYTKSIYYFWPLN